MEAGYTALCGIYDRWQALHGPDFTGVILPRLLASVARHAPPARIHCDVACGTGTMVLEFAKRGWVTSGSDLSAGMIAAAQKKAAAAGVTATFEIQDMRSFTLASPAGLITSFFDSVNHLLTLRDLKAFCTSAAGALLPGGLLVFDTNSERCYKTLWNGPITEITPEFILELKNGYAPSRRRAHSAVTVRYPEHEGGMVETERVEERCYTRKEMLGALRAAGLTPLDVQDFGFSFAPEFGKLKTWWVARKAQ
jgi:predicted TPR repeat methyltransferase